MKKQAKQRKGEFIGQASAFMNRFNSASKKKNQQN